MGKYIYAPVVIRSDTSDGYEAYPATEVKDRIFKRQEFRNCPIRKCIEFIGGKVGGTGSHFARGKRYLKERCGCSTSTLKTTYLIYYKLNSQYSDLYGFNIVKYDEESSAHILVEIADFIKENATESELKRLFCDFKSGELYIDALYSIQRVCLQWLKTDIERNNAGGYNPAANIEKEISAIIIRF